MTGSTNSTASGRLSAVAINFVNTMKRIADKGREPGFSKADWAPLAAFIEQDGFVRVGPYHDQCDWAHYEELITQWVTHSEGWTPVVKRINEAPGVVFMQCEEMITQGDQIFPFHSLAAYEFNAAGKICRIDVFMQQPQTPG